MVQDYSPKQNGSLGTMVPNVIMVLNYSPKQDYDSKLNALGCSPKMKSCMRPELLGV